ncbi:unnamed protein product [Cuscuta campestris]|uniref:Uncharacterized protein n=1 Tax=Cuscuta campestris TaxID=132261 RepID=A0A484L9E6_9ASTE|nr:unnamed protein product [Cuscuta campestris]
MLQQKPDPYMPNGTHPEAHKVQSKNNHSTIHPRNQRSKQKRIANEQNLPCVDLRIFKIKLQKQQIAGAWLPRTKSTRRGCLVGRRCCISGSGLKNGEREQGFAASLSLKEY